MTGRHRPLSGAAHLDMEGLTSVLSSLTGPQFVYAAAKAARMDEQLFPEEREHVARAVDSRRAEFGTARVLARQALTRLGIAPQSLVPHANRAPRWPSETVGSISHSQGYCAVVVARGSEVACVGLDLELTASLREGMDRIICTERERQWLREGDRASSGWLGPLVFSAKESFYKCQYPLTQARLGFQDVEFAFDLATGRFGVAQLSARVPDAGRLACIQGRWCRLPGFVATVAYLTS
jgi:4'-phosphopantetheinyl transferase EntD